MTKLQRKIETVLAGFMYVTIGTVIAVQVNAQGTAAKPSVKKADPAKAEASNCDSKTSADAMCGLGGSAAKSDMKICFANKHPRCFELKKTTLVESLNNMPTHDTTLTNAQADSVLKAVKDYKAWLVEKKAAAATLVCRNAISIELGSEKRDVCIATLPREEMQKKNKALLEILNNPTGSTKN